MVVLKDIDTEWEKIGSSEPYWGVITDEKYKRKNLTPDLKQEFFNSGYDYIEEIFNIISSHLDPNFTPSLGIDFGCGVGRVAIPLSKRCKQVIGVDVSKSMLDEAKRNCVSFNTTNVEFVDDISKIKQKADFINTVLVLQHIETKRGMQIIEDLIEKLNPSGIACIHFPYAFERSLQKRVLTSLFRPIVVKSGLARKMYKRVVLKDATALFGLMYEYNITTILKMLSRKNLNKVFIMTTKYDEKDFCAFGALLFIKK